MGSSSDIDTSVAALYDAWRKFRQGKRASRDILAFEYYLEQELATLSRELTDGSYMHSPYRQFIVHDSKQRCIAVAAVRDRVVHRLLYEYLNKLYDKTFCYDVWSCRPGKGLDRAIDRVQQHMRAYSDKWLWRSDVTKFFDSIDHEILMQCITGKVSDGRALKLISTVIGSYTAIASDRAGLAIGNLTSQICANIYLHEYDRFVCHVLKPLGYVRYGDDIVLWAASKRQVRQMAEQSQQFMIATLRLHLNSGSTVLQPVRRRLHYLGVEFWSTGRRLDKRMRIRLRTRVAVANFSSYDALAKARGTSADCNALRGALNHPFHH